MAAASVFSESPGSEMSDVVPAVDNAVHFSLPFSIIRSQRAATISQNLQAAVPPPSEKQKSLQERIPTFRSMINLTSLREKHSGALRSDSSLSNGAMKSNLAKKSPSNLRTFDEGATLVWKDVTVTIGKKKEGISKAVQGVTGYARPGTMLAIMGPPDSGNSMLLRALAGKLPLAARVYGEILRNGQPEQLQDGTYAFMMRDEDLTETLTIRETLFYAALLQLPSKLPCSEKIARVDTLISEMDLEDVAEARIGKCGEIGGLSVGKRRRVSVALQLLTRPYLVLIDDPISALDSLSAFVVMGMLKKVSNNGCTVVVALEQMSSDIFNLLDKVCLLSSGKTIFFGTTSAALEHYANAGLICPAMYNPADHLLRAINTDYDRVNAPFRFGQDSERGDMWGEIDTAVIIRTLESAYQASGDAAVVQSMVTHLSEKEKNGLTVEGRASPVIRLGVLTWRSFLNMWRDFNYFWLRLILSTLLTLCIGTLGSKIGHSSSSISARAAAIFTMVSTVCLMAVSGFPSIVKDIKVHFNERESGYSGVISFITANLLSSALYLFLISIVCSAVGYFLLGLQAEFSPFVYFVVNLFLCLLTTEGMMLFIASILPRFLEGLIAVLGIQALMIIVARYYQFSDEMPVPVWKYPASYVPFHGYAVEGLLQNEYEDMSFPSSAKHSPPISGQRAIDMAYPFPVTAIGKWNILAVLAGMAGAYRILLCISVVICQKLRPRLHVE
ncbi:unnamed protein product [Calypogeia fissa]